MLHQLVVLGWFVISWPTCILEGTLRDAKCQESVFKLGGLGAEIGWRNWVSGTDNLQTIEMVAVLAVHKLDVDSLCGCSF